MSNGNLLILNGTFLPCVCAQVQLSSLSDGLSLLQMQAPITESTVRDKRRFGKLKLYCVYLPFIFNYCYNYNAILIMTIKLFSRHPKTYLIENLQWNCDLCQSSADCYGDHSSLPSQYLKHSTWKHVYQGCTDLLVKYKHHWYSVCIQPSANTMTLNDNRGQWISVVCHQRCF